MVSDLSSTRLRWLSILSVLAAIAAAWVAAGSTGLLAYPLRRVLVLCLLAVSLLGDPQRLPLSPGRIIALVPAVCLALWLLASRLEVVNIAAVAVVLLVQARLYRSRLHRIAGLAVIVFALWQLLLHSVPSLWLAADWSAGVLGVLPGWLCKRPLDIGPSFAGLDFLLLSGVVLCLWLRSAAGGYCRGLLVAALAIGVVHFLYLVAVAFALDLHELEWIGKASPWNLPALAAVLHLAGLCFLLRRERADVDARRPVRAALFAGLPVALLLPAAATLPTGDCDLSGKKIVACANCFGNWERPKHGDYGRLAIGMYGSMPRFIASLGGEFLLSESLSDADLKGADVLLMIYPHEKWQAGQLERVERFVREGGVMLVLGEHTIREKDGGSRFNDLLASTAMRVNFDSAYFEVGGWLQSYTAMAHPATLGIDDQRNEFGVVIGASLDVRWPARPILIGKWGFGDPGDPQGDAMMGNSKFNTGERLGDVVLAAEQPLGKGMIVAFGDTSSFTNGITMGSHDFVSRLYGYMANRPGGPQDGWRQLLTTFLVLALSFVLTRCRSALLLAVLTATLAASTEISTGIAYRMGRLLPDGRSAAGNTLAYVDGTHMGRFVDESWRLEGTMGLKMTLMRSGYDCLELNEFSRERLMRAGLLVSIAPRRKFSAEECEILRDFVAGGGIYILTVSYPDRAGSQEVLDLFGFEVGRIDAFPGREPQPMGHFKSPYFNSGDYMVFVRFHEAWPVSCVAADAPPVGLAEQQGFEPQTARRLAGWLLDYTLGPGFPWLPWTHRAEVLAYGTGNHPIMLKRRFGDGVVVVVGDSGFALNVNLEVESGAAFEGMRENPHFWRWLLSTLRGPQMWLPPRPAKEKK